MIKNVAFALSALALVTAPAVAQNALAPSMAPLTGDEMGAEGSTGLIIAAIGTVAVIGGVVIIANSGSNQSVSR